MASKIDIRLSDKIAVVTFPDKISRQEIAENIEDFGFEVE